MVMSAAQVNAELQRKKSLGIAPTNQANAAQYNKMTPTPPMSAAAAKGMVHQVATPQFSGAQPILKRVEPSTIMAAKNNPSTGSAPGQFVYDPETDPAYQAAKRRVAADAQTGTNNAMVSLGSRGIGNSQSAVTAASQIQQAGVQKLNDTIIPQLEGQAYQRYQDNRAFDYTTGRDKINDGRYDSETAYNHGRDDIGDTRYNKETEYNHIRDARGDIRADKDTAYNHIRDAKGDIIDKRNFDRGVVESDRNYDRGVLESDRGYDRGVYQDDRNYDYGVGQDEINNGFKQDSSDLNWAQEDRLGNTQNQTPTISGAAAGDFLGNNLKKVVGVDPVTGQQKFGVISDPVTREKAFIDAWNTSGVAPGKDTIEMLTKAGYTTQEIASIKTKYPSAFSGETGK